MIRKEDMDYRSEYEKITRSHGLRTVDGVTLVYSPRLSDAGCTHGFTMRFGGVSESPFDTLNLGYNRPEPKENVTENFHRLARAGGFAFDSMAICNFCHGDGVQRAGREQCGWGFPGGGQFEPCDALYTTDPAVTLITLHADCMPVFLYDPCKKAGAMIHSGWKGTSLRIGQKAALRLIKDCGCAPEDILVFLGPSICPSCFEVDEPVKLIFEEEFPGVDAAKWDDERQKYLIDLELVMTAQLLDAGLCAENIQSAGLCTCCGEGFFSYRRDKKRFGKTGAMAGFLRVAP